ncbi:MAG: IS200/IS605 family accessory protein TnpB-related protein [Ignisphaera sp.]
MASNGRVEKFRGWSNYELAVKVIENEVYVAVYFRRSVKLRKPKTMMTVDMNFDNITLAIFAHGGRMIRLKRFKTPFRKILTHRIWIERIQKRHPRSWRFTKGIRRVIERHGDRIRNIAWDYTHKIGEKVAELASRYDSLVVLENLNHLKETVNGGSSFNKKLSLWFYRRTQFTVGYESLERGRGCIR